MVARVAGVELRSDARFHAQRVRRRCHLGQRGDDWRRRRRGCGFGGPGRRRCRWRRGLRRPSGWRRLRSVRRPLGSPLTAGRRERRRLLAPLRRAPDDDLELKLCIAMVKIDILWSDADIRAPPECLLRPAPDLPLLVLDAVPRGVLCHLRPHAPPVARHVRPLEDAVPAGDPGREPHAQVSAVVRVAVSAVANLRQEPPLRTVFIP